ncbi:MAG: DUF488 family protein, partial [Elusimicrobia bacterium]|nr:DUF488 family protein [Elusimicrobiota bacterium]
LWLKELAPSHALRRWFAHDPAKWQEFKARYFKELAGKAGLVRELKARARGRPIVLLYGAKDREHNQAAALKEYLEKKLAKA